MRESTRGTPEGAVIKSVTESHGVSKIAGRWVLVVTILGSGMAFIDSTAMNVVLPVLQIELDATIPQMQWIIEAYALFMSSLMLFGGALGDKFGRKRIFALGVILFTGASVWCGLSAKHGGLDSRKGFPGGRGRSPRSGKSGNYQYFVHRG